MRKSFRNLLQYMLLAYFVLTIFKGIVMPSNVLYFISCLLMLSLTVFLSSLILNFLTIRENFLTSFVMITLLSVGAYFLIQEFMPGFNIEEYPFDGINTGNLVIHPFPVTVLISMIVGSISYSFVASLFKVLEKNS